MAPKSRKKKEQPPFVTFLIGPEYVDKDGVWNPRDEDPPLNDGYQINIIGTREHYLKLADFIRSFAERDTSNDGDYHDHFQGIMSADGKVQLHIILRKDDVGDSIFKMWYPKSEKKK